MRLNTLSKIYTATMVMLPAINVYKSFIPSVELGTLIILICTFFFLVSKRVEKIGTDVIWGVVLISFLILTMLSYTINYDYNMRFFFRYLKIVIVIISIMYCGKDYFDYNFGIKILTRFSIACTIFIMIQTAFSLIGIHIPGIINSLVSLQENDLEYNDSIYRPAAFFFEPAHFACYQFVFFSYTLTHDIKNKLLLIILTLFGILLSTSGVGYAIAPILLFAASVFGRKASSNMKVVMYSAFAAIVFILLVLNTGIGQIALSRFIDESGEIGGAASGRLDSGANLLFQALPSDLQWIGCGFGYRPEDVYFPSLYAILYGDGYIGLALLIILVIVYFVKTSGFGRLLLIAYSLLFTGSGVFNFGAIGLYFIFISLETAIKNNVRLQRKYNI